MSPHFAGVRNLSALGTVINWQKVEYDFTYHRQDFPCNINVLVCSEGKSLIKVMYPLLLLGVVYLEQGYLLRWSSCAMPWLNQSVTFSIKINICHCQCNCQVEI